MAKYHLNRVVTNAISGPLQTANARERSVHAKITFSIRESVVWNLQDDKAIQANASAQRRLHCAQPCLSVRIRFGPRRIFWRDARKYHLRPYCVTMLSQFYRTLLPFSNRP